MAEAEARAGTRATTFIRQVLQAEQEAEELIASSKKSRLAKMKSAKEKAEQEITAYRADLDRKFEVEMGPKAAADPAAELKGATEREVRSVLDDYQRNKDRTLEYVLGKVLDVSTTLTETQKQALKIAARDHQSAPAAAAPQQADQPAAAPQKPRQPPVIKSMTLESRTNHFDQVNTFHFRPDDDTCFDAGMYMHMIAPGTPAEGPRNDHTVRHMSFASAPKDGLFSFGMDLASGTHWKKAMGDLQPGGKAQYFKIKFKHFAPIWTPEQNQVIFLAGGIGITPIRSLIVEHSGTFDWRLIHVARDRKHLYAAELAELGRVDCTDRAGAAAAVSAAVAEKPGAFVYMCGSERFMNGMYDLLAAAGVKEDMIKAECFN